MSLDPTHYAEQLLRAVARAFYEDIHILLIDILIRDKYLRQDEMNARLSIPGRELKEGLMFLMREKLVKTEKANDSSGDNHVVFWYIDYNVAVKVIMLRVHLLQEMISKREAESRTNVMFQCPQYDIQCHGQYTLEQAQKFIDFSDPTRGRYLCHQCKEREDRCNAMSDLDSYTLKEVNNSQERLENLVIREKVKSQLSRLDSDTGEEIRPGIFEIIAHLRTITTPLSSNLPSENLMQSIGSSRLAGTGRTAGLNRDYGKSASGAVDAMGGDAFMADMKGNRNLKVVVDKSGNGREGFNSIDDAFQKAMSDGKGKGKGKGEGKGKSKGKNIKGASDGGVDDGSGGVGGSKKSSKGKKGEISFLADNIGSSKIGAVKKKKTNNQDTDTMEDDGDDDDDDDDDVDEKNSDAEEDEDNEEYKRKYAEELAKKRAEMLGMSSDESSTSDSSDDDDDVAWED